jgi:Na+/H+ antiporter NhaD/arsenite permease-like protein
MPLQLIALGVVFLLIAIRQIGRFRFQIWQIMLGGAVTVLLTGSIQPADALRSINPDVMLFLFGMFTVGQALEDSGYLAHISYRWVRKAATRNALLWMLVFGSGLLSAVLMNDTLAIVGTPVVLLLARKHDMPPQLLLLALAFGITTGSVLSPIGNPQNLLIALSGGVPNQFLTFLAWLGVPTLINLALTCILLRRLYRDDFHATDLRHSQEPIRDRHLAGLARISLLITLILVGARIALSVAGIEAAFSLTHIALAAALPVLVGSPRRWRILRRLDWTTLVFFAAMFVLMQSVWDTGLMQSWMTASGFPLGAPETILGVGVVMSQLVSNVPLVALYLPVLQAAGSTTAGLMALAAGSTIAGNLLLLGAASNVIIVENAERRSKQTISFLEFARVGIPLTAMQTVVYWVFLRGAQLLIS